MKRITNALVIILLPQLSLAQAIDNTLSFKNISSDSYFRINYENDFFSATDKYYTQGFDFELAAPWIKDFPLSHLLIKPANSYIRYGLSLEHNAYTPTSIGSDTILHGDRPFAADVTLKTFAIAIDTVHKSRLSTTFSLGAIGPVAIGAEMQTGIHRVTNNRTPHGWPNQIKNDVVVNYQVDYEKQLIHAGRIFSLDADGMARGGTLNDKAALGITLMGGYFDSPFSDYIVRGSNFRLYAYEHPELDIVGYDATLQGGLFDKKSPYTIPADQIERFVFQNRFGFVLVYRRLYLEYFQSLLSAEFKTGNYHVWGGIQIAFGL
jgi:hypothetical protein